MCESIESLDRSLFLFLNGIHTDWMDPIMQSISSKTFWIPLYLLIFFFIQRKFGWKNLGWFALGVALVILFCDQISSTILKPYFGRYRPCNNLDIKALVHTVNGGCGSGYSFVSGHATNFFGLSIFAARFFKHTYAHVLFFCWATTIAYSRIYLGLHYPADLFCGACLGFCLGTGLYLLNRWAVLKTDGKYGLDESRKR